MELHYHPGEHDDNDLKQKEVMLREEVAAEKEVNKTPRHGST
ncbi:unnamed protein product [marine sediment metagenome]|uniref:Uncharacterized protein n=1 Tax=marine sediment metagenome TaxID=412755 RepID=X1UEN6_9ZZZZ